MTEQTTKPRAAAYDGDAVVKAAKRATDIQNSVAVACGIPSGNAKALLDGMSEAERNKITEAYAAGNNAAMRAVTIEYQQRLVDATKPKEAPAAQPAAGDGQSSPESDAG